MKEYRINEDGGKENEYTGTYRAIYFRYGKVISRRTAIIAAGV